MICFDRDNESARLWEYFLKGKNILMLAPRRIGKTVLINRLKEESERNGYRAIVLDVEGFREEKDFFKQMCTVIQEELGTSAGVLAALTEKLRNIIRGSESAGGDWRQILLQTDWREFANHLLSHLNNDKEGDPWLVLVDEIPIFSLALITTHGIERLHDFLYTLRSLRNNYRNIRWLYTGSIGMDTIARRHSIEGALTDLETFPLRPFAHDDAATFLNHIAAGNGRHMDLEAAERIIERLGWLSPYYLEKIADVACNLTCTGQTISLIIADNAVDAMLGLDKRTYWSTWREHLNKNFLDPEQTHLFTILKTVAQSPEGIASRNTLLSELNRGQTIGDSQLRAYLDTLEADGYLVICSDRKGYYRFQMGLLRDWWLRYVAT
ncbi:MAG: AAA-like domain-containing protein [Syntrophales bacterium]|jgi:hypothetical protein|nr:AAA-like domain-containing protein [Syntrophales bacterium]